MKRFGLPKTSLIRKSGEFAQVYQQGRRLKGAGFTVLYLANDLGRTRLGVSIHRMLRGSVRRNRIKRIVKEVFRLHRDFFPTASDIVITIGPHFKYPSYESFRQAVFRLISPSQEKES